MTLAITTGQTLPGGQVGTPYRVALTAAGGVAPYIWAVGSGKLPPGLSLDKASGVIAGTPTGGAWLTLLLVVTDSAAPAATASANVTINIQGSAAALSITTTALPSGTAGTAYTATLGATGGQPPYGWTASGLPAGLSQNSSGVVAGTPTTAQTNSCAFSVKDSAGGAATRTLGLTVAAAPTPTPTPTPKPAIYAAYASGYQWLYDDYGSGAAMDVTAFLPTPPAGYFWLGHSLMTGRSGGFSGAPAITVKPIDPNSVAPPIGFKLVWDDQGSGGSHDYSFWQLIPPPGYVALGALYRLRQGDYNPPSAQDVAGLRCVRQDLVTVSAWGGLVWLNNGCDAANSASVFSVVPGAKPGYAGGQSATVWYQGTNTAQSSPPSGQPPLPVLTQSAAVVFQPNPVG